MEVVGGGGWWAVVGGGAGAGAGGSRITGGQANFRCTTSLCCRGSSGRAVE